MTRSIRYTLFSLALLGCHAAGAEEMARPSGASATKAPKVGTDPGKVGNGTPLTARPGHELAAFAAGCFWGVEDAFRKVPGVTATAVGYTGGHTKNPTYEKVCDHDTGHAETVLVEFDPARISYEKLLLVFFKIHDPTTLNSQGPDFGDQYRSAIFTFSPKQAAAATKAAAHTEADIHEHVVTVVSPIGPFYKAEGYHQQYAERTGTHGCPVRGFTGVI
jgi:peptide-methionine (S)-S-oxide reductase